MKYIKMGKSAGTFHDFILVSCHFQQRFHQKTRGEMDPKENADEKAPFHVVKPQE